MGPSTLFDKSFIQMLNLDEAVLFDKFYSGVICPVFYAEVLADVHKGNDPEEAMRVVSRLCEKTPVMHSYPTAYHRLLLEKELSGRRMNLDGRPAVAFPKVTMLPNGKKGILYDGFPEAEAFSRWQEGNFLEVERSFAADWRSALQETQLKEAAEFCRDAFSIKDRVRDLREAANLARVTIEVPERAREMLFKGSVLLGLDLQYATRAVRLLSSRGAPPLRKLFPYFVHCLTVELFFHISVAKTLISPDRASNKVDVAYLFYLPFCEVFVSNDRLHRSCAEVFLCAKQSFLGGQVINEDLTRLDEHYSAKLEQINEVGLFRAISAPPEDLPSETRRLWRKYRPRAASKSRPMKPMDSAMKKQESEILIRLQKNIEAMKAADPISVEVDFDHEDVEQMAISRTIPRSMGKYTIIPKRNEPS